MGQQQLLLIVLGVIIVGIAIVVGINLFNANSVSANRDAVISDLNNIGAMAHQYYMKPTSMGGGGNSFANFNIPSGFSTTPNGTYSIVGTASATSVTFQGVGTASVNNTDKVTVDLTVYAPNSSATDTVVVVH